VYEKLVWITYFVNKNLWVTSFNFCWPRHRHVETCNSLRSTTKQKYEKLFERKDALYHHFNYLSNCFMRILFNTYVSKLWSKAMWIAQSRVKTMEQARRKPKNETVFWITCVWIHVSLFSLTSQGNIVVIL